VTPCGLEWRPFSACTFLPPILLKLDLVTAEIEYRDGYYQIDVARDRVLFDRRGGVFPIPAEMVEARYPGSLCALARRRYRGPGPMCDLDDGRAGFTGKAVPRAGLKTGSANCASGEAFP
jgi:hypothetical protein